MAESSFPIAHKRMLAYEGGYANHPNDPGGVTLNGVTQRVYNAWRRAKKLPKKALTRAMDGLAAWNKERDTIYRERYWLPTRCRDLEPGVDAAIYDYNVNSGIGRGAKVLQRLVGAKVDGRVGPKTIEAANKRDPEALVTAICAEREAFFRWLAANKSGMNVFLKGWLRRVADVRKYTTVLAKNYKASGEEPVPEPALAAEPTAKGEIPEPRKTKAAAVAAGPVVIAEEAGRDAAGVGEGWADWIAAHPAETVLFAVAGVALVVLVIVGINLWRKHRQETPMPGFDVVPEVVK